MTVQSHERFSSSRFLSINLCSSGAGGFSFCEFHIQPGVV
jgi:hypothetical protein